MCLLGGRRLYNWLGIPCGKERSIEPPPQLPSVSCVPPQERPKEEETEEEEQHFAPADKSDSQLLELTRNGLRSLHRKFELTILGKTYNDAFTYWEFPLWLSQSRLGGRKGTSNACTLITMTIASSFYGDSSLSDALRLNHRREGLTQGEQIAMAWHKVCPSELIRLMKDAIVKGNNIYDEEKKRGKHSVMYEGNGQPLKDIITLPDAIMARNRFVRGGSGEVNKTKDKSVMTEVHYIAVKGSIGKYLSGYIKYAIRHSSLSDWNIFCFIVICSEKAVSLMYRKDIDVFCLMDSHAHDGNKTGSIVAVSNRRNFSQMSIWMEQRLFPDPTNSKPKKFELSLLQWMDPNAISPLNPNVFIRKKIYRGSSSSSSIPSPLSSIRSCFPSRSIPSSESGYSSDEVHS